MVLESVKDGKYLLVTTAFYHIFKVIKKKKFVVVDNFVDLTILINYDLLSFKEY